MRTQLRIAGALDDAEDELVFRARLLAAFPGPAQRPLHRAPHIRGRSPMGRTIIEHHGDVRAQHALDVHRFLRPEEQQRTIEMRAKLDTVCLDFANLRQTENLEAATVGQDGLVPVHEAVQSPCGLNDFKTWANG